MFAISFAGHVATAFPAGEECQCQLALGCSLDQQGLVSLHAIQV